jgi:methionine-S-sulfoxide reductase
MSETAILAGGCFWGMQDLIRKRPGVISTRVGYSGGDVPHATYRNHGTHAEAIEIVFDPDTISYRDILEFFFQIHDPTTPNRRIGQRFILRQNSSEESLPTRSMTSTRLECGQEWW